MAESNETKKVQASEGKFLERIVREYQRKHGGTHEECLWAVLKDQALQDRLLERIKRKATGKQYEGVKLPKQRIARILVNSRSEKEVRKTIYCPSNLLSVLEGYATIERRSVSGQIVHMLEEHIDILVAMEKDKDFATLVNNQIESLRESSEEDQPDN